MGAANVDETIYNIFRSVFSLKLTEALVKILPSFSEERGIDTGVLVMDFATAWCAHRNLIKTYYYHVYERKITPSIALRLWTVAEPTNGPRLSYGHRFEIILLAYRVLAEICDQYDAEELLYRLQNNFELSVRKFDLRKCPDINKWQEIMLACFSAINRIRERFALDKYEPACICPALLDFIKIGEFELIIF
jgi:hypothetical protein